MYPFATANIANITPDNTIFQFYVTVFPGFVLNFMKCVFQYLLYFLPNYFMFLSQVDTDISRLLGLMTDRQKRCAKYAERLSKVHELSHQLNRCHTLLNQTLESMETLNNWLPLEERLEPFVWTTG